jgi:hypothetical protein
MAYCYPLSIEHSVTIDEHGDKITRVSTVWHNFGNYVRSKRGNYRKDAEAELSAFNAALDLYKSELLFKSEIDRTFFLLRFS